MNLTTAIDQLLADMDTIRPIVIAAMPEDQALRARTRRMIAQLESIRRAPAVPLSSYLWLSHLMSQLLDAEHGTLLKPADDGLVPAAARAAIETHTEQRQRILAQALQEIPTTQLLLDRLSKQIGCSAGKDVLLAERARHLEKLLREHLQQDSAFRDELRQLIAAFMPSMSAIANVLEQIGEDAPELRQAQDILEQELPADVDEARALLRHARQNILRAGTTLTTAGKKLSSTIQDQVEKLTALSSQLKQAESDARNDPLTGLPNRRSLAEFLNRMETTSFCFLIIDIDFFKKINDNYGHDVGDLILQQLALILQEGIRDTDLVARIGGEEFCIVFPAIDADTSMALADKLRQSIATSIFHAPGREIKVTVSIGVAENCSHVSHSDTFKAADQALYLSKKNGRNQVTKKT